jgi:hypothetical protein
MIINRQLPRSGHLRGFTSRQISGIALVSLDLVLDIWVEVMILAPSSAGRLTALVSSPKLDAEEERSIDGLVYADSNN